MARGKAEPETLEEMKLELQKLRDEKDEAERKLTIAQDEMKKTGAVKAELQTKLRSWPEIDWTKPAWSVWLMADEDKPAQGVITVTDKGEKYSLKFDNGWCVTNDLDAARKITDNLKKQYAISEIRQ